MALPQHFSRDSLSNLFGAAERLEQTHQCCIGLPEANGVKPPFTASRQSAPPLTEPLYKA